MQRIEFSPPLANAADFPPAILKIEPQQPMCNLSWFANQSLQQLNIQFFRSGRGALYFAAEQLKKPGGNLILLPAYHCPALVEPFIAAGYQIEFYPLQADLTVDLKVLQKLITPETTHCLLVRYFGNEAQVNTQLDWLAAQGLITFDDCAHDLQSFIRPQLVANATICSLKKFIAANDGGALRLRNLQTATLKPAPLLVEVKNLVRTLLSGWRWFSAKQPMLLPFTAEIESHIDGVQLNAIGSNEAAVPETQPKSFRYLRQHDRQDTCYRLTKWQFYHTNLQQSLYRRQQNCKLLMAGLVNARLGRLLWQEVPDDCAPYVIPFVLDDGRSFYQLRKRGLQVYRWEELAPADCLVSKDYRQRLIQIPCHQDLTPDDIIQIIAAIS